MAKLFAPTGAILDETNPCRKAVEVFKMYDL